jgi:hypothetical protein
MAYESIPPIPLCDSCDKSFTGTDFHRTQSLLDQLRANYNPLPREFALATSNVQLAKADLARCEDEIAKLKARLDTMERRADRTRLFIDSQTSLSSPIRRIPVEVMSIILKDACNQTFIVSPKLRSSNHRSLRKAKHWICARILGFAVVCKIWRSILLSIPEVWSHILIDLDKSDDVTTEILAVLLERSRQHPLSVCVQSFRLPSGEPRPYPSCLALLEKHFGRFTFLHVEGYGDPFWDVPLSSLQALTQIKTLSISTFVGYWRTDNRMSWIPFLNNLSTVCVNSGENSAPQGLSDVMPLPESVTELDTSDQLYSAALYHMSLCPQLKTARLAVESGWPEDLIEPGDFIFRKLEKLRVTAYKDQAFGLQCLAVPALRRLSLEYAFTKRQLDKGEETPDMAWPHHDFIAFLENPRSNLRETLTDLSLDTVQISGVELLQILRRLPSIEMLALHETEDDEYDRTCITNELLEGLVWLPGAVGASNLYDGFKKDLLPRLEHLRLTLNGSHERLEALIPVVKSRLPEHAPLMPSISVETTSMPKVPLKSVSIRLYGELEDRSDILLDELYAFKELHFERDSLAIKVLVDSVYSIS